MFDISWTEFMMIGVVALIVIGPKELPGVLRMVGQWTRKVRGMAAEFQNQFHEAMREAEMADLKKQVDDIAKDIKDFDPLKGIRNDVESAGRDIERSFNQKQGEQPMLPAAAMASEEGAVSTAPEPAIEAAAPTPLPEPAAVPVVPVERADLPHEAAAGPADPSPHTVDTPVGSDPGRSE